MHRLHPCRENIHLDLPFREPFDLDPAAALVIGQIYGKDAGGAASMGSASIVSSV